jgi:integrase
MRLTKANISKVSVPPGKSEIIVLDDAPPGFGLRVRIGGSATFIFQYRIGAKQRRMNLRVANEQMLSQARKTAEQLYHQTKLGKDPAAEKAAARTKAAETFGSILRPFLAYKKRDLKARSYEECERHLLMHARRLQGLQIDAIDRRTIGALLTALATNNGPSLANSVRASLSGFFSWAMREGLSQANPVIGTNRAVVNGSRDRVLTDDELRSIWNALANDPYGDILKLLALLGQRRDEIGGLRWSEVNFDKAMISLPAERTKNSRPHDVPLAPMALAILKARPHVAGREYVFTTGASGFRGWSNYKVTLDARIAAKGAISPWRLHDLRRTAATRMAELGVQPHIIEACLNHVSGHKAGVAGIYNRATYEPEKRQALTLWSEHLLAVVEGRQSKVVAIKGKPRR